MELAGSSALAGAIDGLVVLENAAAEADGAHSSAGCIGEAGGGASTQARAATAAILSRSNHSVHADIEGERQRPFASGTRTFARAADWPVFNRGWGVTDAPKFSCKRSEGIFNTGRHNGAA